MRRSAIEVPSSEAGAIELPAPGTLIDGRFLIDGVSSPSGAELDARDRRTGQRVTLRLLPPHRSAEDAARSGAEVQLVQELSHPNLAACIAHGTSERGLPYLVMEVPAGGELAQRLRHGTLSVSEVLTLLGAVGSGLSVLHRRGLVHGNISPASIRLRDEQLATATLCGFRLGREPRAASGRLRTDAASCSPQYLAPEQARGGGELGPGVDVFALGCVLFECLTGQPPFGFPSIAALLARLLFEDAPRLRSLRPELPAALDELVARMLARDPASRFADIDEVLVAGLRSVRAMMPAPPEPAQPVTRALLSRERRVVSVLWVAPPHAAAEPSAEGPAAEAMTNRGELRGKLVGVLSRFGALGDWLADGSLVATLGGSPEAAVSRAASDQAARAARLSLTVKALWPEARVVLTTSLGELPESAPGPAGTRGAVGAVGPIGEGIERAERLIGELGTDEPAASVPWAVPVVLDEVTAGLLDVRFRVSPLRPGQVALLGEAGFVSEARRLLGRPTPCVGRDRELALLDSLFAQCRDEPTARVALVLGEAGLGKSRLCYEFQRRLHARGESVQVLLGRGDPLLSEAPYAPLGQALRSLCGVQDSEPPATSRERLREHVARLVPPSEAARIDEHVAELCAVSASGAAGPQRRAGRLQPSILAEQVQRAFIELLRATCRQAPVVLILEDLHWCDPGTLRLVDAAVRELTEQPLLVLALARPELLGQSSPLLGNPHVQPLRLTELSRKAGERLVQQVLGASATRSTVEQILDRSTGNPLYLEELIRAAVAGKREQLPETLLAMLQARLLGLSPDLRHVLRAASIFGTTFWRGGVQLLLGGVPTALLDDWLHALVASEVIEPHRTSQIAGEAQLGFRHVLMRDAAYSLLIEEDRRLGHRLAAQYLGSVGVSAPQVLAEHFERGGDPAAAARQCLLAAERAHRNNDPNGALALAQRGLAGEVPEALRGELLGLVCQVYLWRNELATAGRYVEGVLQRVPPGSQAWAVAVATQIVGSRLGDPVLFHESLERARTIEPVADASGVLAFALMLGVFMLDVSAEFTRAEPYLLRLHELVEPLEDEEPLARAWLHLAHAHREAWAHAAPALGLWHAESAGEAFRLAEFHRGLGVSQTLCGMNAWLLGDLGRAERELRAALEYGDELGLLSPLRTSFLARVLLELGRPDEAEELGRRMVESAAVRDAPLLAGLGHAAWGAAALQRGELAVAGCAIASALPLLRQAPLEHTIASVTQAELLLRGGQQEAALRVAETAVHESQELGSFGYLGADAYLVLGTILRRCGQRERGRSVLREAWLRSCEQADALPDPTLREPFCGRRVFRTLHGLLVEEALEPGPDGVPAGGPDVAQAAGARSATAKS
jgi:tetratricopeptide (TPR) repeat protein